MASGSGKYATSALVFGSCNRQNKPQSFWSSISQQLQESESAPVEMFFWTGDSVYTKGNNLEKLAASYQMLLSDGNYTDFVSQTKMQYADGIWDDHDLGINDAGFLPDREKRAELYLNFLTNNSNSNGNGEFRNKIHKKWQMNYWKERDGLYHSREINRGKHGNLKLLFLDTRYAREPHYIPSLGEIDFPLTALIAASIRTIYTFLGFGALYDKSVLSDKQWIWLEQELKTSKSDYHVIVSSVQIMTTNPAVESWGHFPKEKTKLIQLVAKYNPKGLTFLSGDVHHGEIANLGFNKATITNKDAFNFNQEEQEKVMKKQEQKMTTTKKKNRKNFQDEWIESTSSGLTHTCGDGLITRFLCPLMLNTFTRHRKASTDPLYFIGKNYGKIHFDKSNLDISVVSLKDGKTVLNNTVYPYPLDFSFLEDSLSLKKNEFGGIDLEETFIQENIADFYRIPRDATPIEWIVYAFCIVSGITIIYRLLTVLRKRNSILSKLNHNNRIPDDKIKDISNIPMGKSQKEEKKVNETSRVFFAVSLKEEMKTELFDITRSYRDLSTPIEFKTQWVPKDNLHITIQFIGDIKTEKIPLLISMVQKSLDDYMASNNNNEVIGGKESRETLSPFLLSLSSVGAFPNTKMPRILWGGVQENCHLHLIEIRKVIHHAVQQLLETESDVLSSDNYNHIQGESEHYQPHVTVARCNFYGKSNKKGKKKPKFNYVANAFLKNQKEYQSTTTVRVSSFELYESKIIQSKGKDKDVGKKVEDYAGRSGSVYEVMHLFHF
jgi:alkaline phosphatase D